MSYLDSCYPLCLLTITIVPHYCCFLFVGSCSWDGTRTRGADQSRVVEWNVMENMQHLATIGNVGAQLR